MIKIKIDYKNLPQNKNYRNSEIRKKLEKAHHKKCCYCETFLFEAGEIEHFRPKKTYYWLENEYENLLWVCSTCNKHKSNKLPVKEIIAIEPDNVDVCDEKEELIMINPARSENINNFSIAFNKKCEITSENSLIQNTINICRLNRDALAEERRKIYQEFENIINEMKKKEQKENYQNYLNEKLISPLKENKELCYIAFRKFIIKNWLGEMMKPTL